MCSIYKVSEGGEKVLKIRKNFNFCKFCSEVFRDFLKNDGVYGIL